MTQAREHAASSVSDAELIEAVRHGSTESFGTLYQRHLSAARRMSTHLARSEAEREEIVSEAFARILKVLKAGKGPTEEFRPYLLATMRNIAINTTRQQSPLALVEDMTVFDSPEDVVDPATADFDRRMITGAFTSLPERWRAVLWHTEVEGEPPAAVAPLLGMSPNGVSALAYRAREGLSRAYLQMHLPSEERDDCRAGRRKLGGYVRGSLTEAEARKIRDHLDDCDRCRALAAGLIEINNDLRAIIAPLVLGAPLAAAYLGTSSTVAAGALSVPAKTASVGGQALVKVAVVLATALGIAGAAAQPDAEPVAAPEPPLMDVLRRYEPPPTPVTEPPAPPPAPVSPTTVPPAPPAPAPAPKPEKPAPKPAERPPKPVPPSPATAPRSLVEPGHDCRPSQPRNGCAPGRLAEVAKGLGRLLPHRHGRR